MKPKRSQPKTKHAASANLVPVISLQTSSTLASEAGPEQKHDLSLVEPQEPGTVFGKRSRVLENPKDEPTPFELAFIATQLAIVRKDKDPRNYLSEAHALLRASAAFLEKTAGGFTSFDELLERSRTPEGSKTPIHGITTLDGLRKAIRREFDFPESEVMIARGGMTDLERYLLDERIQERRSANARNSRRAKR